MLPLLRANVGLSISFALLGAGLLVCTLVGFIMSRSGASLRPIYWFAGFFALVVIPQTLGHFYKALHTAKTEAPRAAALRQLAAPAKDSTDAVGRSMDAKSLFGPDVDPQLISDVRAAYGDVFAEADFAQFAVLPNGDTALLARFKTGSSAEKAWVHYLRLAGLQAIGKGDSHRGYAVTRPVGDRVYALPFGTMLGVWTGADDARVRARMLAGGFEIPSRAPLGGADASNPKQSRDAASVLSQPRNPFRIALISFGIAVYSLLVIAYFFKGSAWSGTYRAKPGVPPLTARELAARLETINQFDVPFQVERGSQPNEFFATWRYADAKWIDLARVRNMKRTFRIRMLLDETAHTIRATDYVASYDGSVGRGGANLEWKAGMGLILFQREHQRVFGLQLDEQGRLKPDLSYAYTFHLDELKSPLMETVSHAGWDWRPTVWQGPRWLRWLTE